MTNAALLEQLEMSSSVAMIFFTRATGEYGQNIGSTWLIVMSVDVRGNETVPVISLVGVIGVLLYGMVADRGSRPQRPDKVSAVSFAC